MREFLSTGFQQFRCRVEDRIQQAGEAAVDVLLAQLGVALRALDPQPPLRAGLEAGPLALAFTTMSILGPRLSARFGARSITFGAGLDVLGTIAMAVTGVRYGGHLTGWDLAPATAVIGLGQGMALPSLIGAALSRVPPERAGAAAGILTTTHQFGAASGVAVIGAVFYGRLGSVPSRGGSVSAMVLAIAIDAAIVLAAAGLTVLLPRRAAARRTSVTQEQAAEERAEAVH
jgi:MFS family permease